jgi:hypothetical protein
MKKRDNNGSRRGKFKGGRRVRRKRREENLVSGLSRVSQREFRFTDQDILRFLGPGPGLPKMWCGTLKYFDTQLVRTNVGHSFQNWVYRSANTAAQIDPTPGTGNLTGIVMFPSYFYVRITSIAVSGQIENPELGAVTFVLYPSSDGNPFGSAINTLTLAQIQSVMNERNSFKGFIGPVGSSNNILRINKKFHFDNLISEPSYSWKADPGWFVQTSAGNSAKQCRIAMCAYVNDGAVWVTGLCIQLTVKLEYELFQPIIV